MKQADIARAFNVSQSVMSRLTRLVGSKFDLDIM